MIGMVHNWDFGPKGAGCCKLLFPFKLDIAYLDLLGKRYYGKDDKNSEANC